MKNILFKILILLCVMSCGKKISLRTYTFDELRAEETVPSDSFAIVLSDSRHPDEPRELIEQDNLRVQSPQSIRMTSLERDGKVLIKFESPIGYLIEKTTHQDTIFVKAIPISEQAKKNGFCIIEIVKNNAFCYRGSCKMTRDCVMYNEGHGSRNCVCQGEREPAPAPSDPWPYPQPPSNEEDPYDEIP